MEMTTRMQLQQSKWWIAVAAMVLLIGARAFVLQSGGQPKQDLPGSAEAPALTKDLVAGPGLVEPESEDVKVGSELSGKLKEVLAEEGDAVKKGQVLAVLENDDYRAQVENCRGQMHQAQAAYEKVLNGSRPQERREYLAEMQRAETVEANARSDYERSRKLFDDGIISREAMDHAERDLKVAENQLESARQQHLLVDDRSRAEDIAAAKGQMESAQAQLAEKQAVYAKTFLKAPFDGTILRKHHRTGESITNSSVTPDPVFTMGDVDSLRIRMDVDETDVSRVTDGQRVYVTAPAYPGQKFWGRIIRVAGQLGHKNVRTDEPKEKVDTKILETLVQMDPGSHLPVGLRVDAFIDTSSR
jgi:HlyD family secretion protein